MAELGAREQMGADRRDTAAFMPGNGGSIEEHVSDVVRPRRGAAEGVAERGGALLADEEGGSGASGSITQYGYQRRGADNGPGLARARYRCGLWWLVLATGVRHRRIAIVPLNKSRSVAPYGIHCGAS